MSPRRKELPSPEKIMRRKLLVKYLIFAIIPLVTMSFALAVASLILESKGVSFRDVIVVSYGIPVVRDMSVNYVFALVLSLTLGMYAVLVLPEIKRTMKFESEIPIFLNMLAEAVSAGAPFISALEQVTRGGMLSVVPKEMSEVIKRVRLGEDFREAITVIEYKYRKSPLIIGFCSVLRLAYTVGGAIRDILLATSSIYERILRFREQKRTKISPYISVTYLSQFVLSVSAAFILIFAKALAKAPLMIGGISETQVEVMGALMFYGLIVSSLINGAMAGKFSYEKIGGGLHHMAILIAVTTLIFYLVTTLGTNIITM